PVVSTQFLQWDQPLSFPSFDRHRATLLVSEKIFYCPQQKRTKSSFFPADGTQLFALQQLREKTLRNILRFLSSNALSPDKAIDRSPINAAKFLECFLCCWRFTLCGQHHAPVGRCKGDCPVARASTEPSQ